MLFHHRVVELPPVGREQERVTARMRRPRRDRRCCIYFRQLACRREQCGAVPLGTSRGASGALRSFLHARGGAPDDPALAGRGEGRRGWVGGGKGRGMLDADALHDLLRRVEEDEIRQTADPKRDGK